MKPTVGRQVHFYSKNTSFSISEEVAPRVDPYALVPRSFRGPFAATIVYVHDDGSVNLHVLWPQMGRGTSQVAEIVERVTEAQLTVDEFTRSCWVWPPRV